MFETIRYNTKTGGAGAWEEGTVREIMNDGKNKIKPTLGHPGNQSSHLHACMGTGKLIPSNFYLRVST